MITRHTGPVEPDFDSPLSAAVALRDADMPAVVRAALKQGDVMLAFQPVMYAGPKAQPAFWEGLLRVLDPMGRVIPAGQFVPLVEELETGRLLDCRALEIGLRTLAGEPALRLSINLSARSIGYPLWRQTLDAGLARDVTIAERLILEITEASAILMPEVVTAFMSDLARRGIAFALDDFGAGYTAFRYFRQFLFDIVKIDGQFTRNVDSDPDNQVLVQALVSIGRHFDMLTVAEAVETPEQARFLQQIGVDCLQGYLFAAPSFDQPWHNAARRRA